MKDLDSLTFEGREGDGNFVLTIDILDCRTPWMGQLTELLRTQCEWEGDRSVQHAAAAAAKLLQSCPTLCYPRDMQPTRLPRPWDSPGKNPGVGCHVLLQCMKVKSENEVAQSCPTPSNPMDCSLPGSSVHGIFQARVTLAFLFFWKCLFLTSLRFLDHV